MLQSLRSRLLLSYLLVIIAVLVLMVGALVATTALTQSRSFQAAIELNAVARPILMQLRQAVQETERPSDALDGKIDAIADEFNMSASFGLLSSSGAYCMTVVVSGVAQ